MGLDQYAFRRPEKIEAATDFERDDGDGLIAQWRKHPNLHGWMQDLYVKKGGTDKNFNCNPVQLTPEDIDQLEKDVEAGKLPPTTGFFFGQSCPEHADEDRAFIKAAREAFAEGDSVYYDSWW